MQDDRKRLVVTEGRCERVYKRTGEPNVTFCGEEARRSGCAAALQKGSDIFYDDDASASKAEPAPTMRL